MIPKIPFYFLRHGQTDWNVVHRLQGHSDIPLNNIGVEQARNALGKLIGNKINRVVAGPLLRTQVTGGIVAEGLKIPLLTDLHLIERSFGVLEGQTYEEIKEIYGVTIDQVNSSEFAFEKSEDWENLKQRAVSTVARWNDGTTLLAGHGAFMLALTEILLGYRVVSKNATPYLFVPTETGWDMREV